MILQLIFCMLIYGRGEHRGIDQSYHSNCCCLAFCQISFCSFSNASLWKIYINLYAQQRGQGLFMVNLHITTKCLLFMKPY